MKIFKAYSTIILVFLALFSQAQYSATGGTVTTIANGNSWANVADAVNDDGNRATVGLSGSDESDYIVVTNFGFEIPEDETVNGIEVTINKSHTNLFSYVTDLEVRLVQGGALVGSNRANFGGYPVFDVNYTYGSSIDNWGLTLEPDDINDSDFGVAIASQRVFGFGGSTARIDNVSISVFTTAPLPVELVAFDAELVGDKVDLTWTTASEINNDYFEIQKSQDGFVFQTVARVQGNGNSVNMIDYQYEDGLEASGKYYYRLKQVDFDGTYAYSETVYIDYVNQDPAEVFPNPATNINGFKNIKSEIAEAMITSMEGVTVHTQAISNHIPIDVRTLPRGWYIVQVKDGMDITYHKILIR